MHILITGASRGIGAAIAERFATSQPDLRLSLCARNMSSLLIVQTHLKSISSIETFVHPCDVTDADRVEAVVANAQESFGPVDVLINNAGIGHFAPADQMKTEDFDRVLSTNLRGVFLMTKAVLPSMIERKSGSIVTISSLAGRNGFAGGAAYCASKFGVRGLMQSLFLEVRDHNIRVMTVFPGTVDTDFFAPMGGMSSSIANPLLAQDVAQAVVSAVSEPTRATISELDIRPTKPR